MFDKDIGVVLPLECVQDGRPVDLSGAQEVTLLLHTGVTLPLTVVNPNLGWVDYVSTGTLAPDFYRANVHVKFDAQHVYHFGTAEFRVQPLGT